VGPTPAHNATIPTAEDSAAAATSINEFSELQEAVDSLQSSASLVSVEATKEVLVVLPSSVETLRMIGKALGNNAIVGYALKERLRQTLDRANQQRAGLNLCSVDGAPVHLPVARVLFCDDRSQVEELLKTRRPANTWIFVPGRQGAFDAVHIKSNTHIRFLQLTAGQSHTIKLHIIATLLASLKVTWSHLEFLMVRPQDDTRGFRLQPLLED